MGVKYINKPPPTATRFLGASGYNKLAGGSVKVCPLTDIDAFIDLMNRCAEDTNLPLAIKINALESGIAIVGDNYLNQFLDGVRFCKAAFRFSIKVGDYKGRDRTNTTIIITGDCDGYTVHASHAIITTFDDCWRTLKEHTTIIPSERGYYEIDTVPELLATVDDLVDQHAHARSITRFR